MIVPYRLRMMVPPEARVLGSRLFPAARAERRAIERNFVLPSSLVPQSRRSGSVWGVAMMRNEEDTVRHVVEHMFNQDVDALLVADNDSSDGTSAILASLAEQHPIHIVHDHLVAYAQGPKMTMLSALARQSGADWIVPFDADELWFAVDRSVGRFLRASTATVVRARVHDVFPSSDDDPDEPDPFLRLRHIDPVPFPVGKVAFRAHPLAKVAIGNLDVTLRGPRTDGLFIAHYPWRTYEQMAGKLRHGRRALAETKLSEEMGIHWRVAGGWPDERLRAAWDDLLVGRAVEELSWSPLGELELRSPGTWPTWQPLTESSTLV